MVRIPFEFAFDIASNPVRMIQICVRMVRISFEWFKFAFKPFECRSNGYNPFQMVRICFGLCRISFEWLEFAFEWLESLSNGLTLTSILSKLVRIKFCIQNPFRMVRISFRWLRISFDWFEFAFQWLESFWNGSNLQSIPLNLVRIVQICIWMVRILSNGLNLRTIASNLECFEFAFDCFESRSNSSNLH